MRVLFYEIFLSNKRRIAQILCKAGHTDVSNEILEYYRAESYKVKK